VKVIPVVKYMLFYSTGISLRRISSGPTYPPLSPFTEPGTEPMLLLHPLPLPEEPPRTISGRSGSALSMETTVLAGVRARRRPRSWRGAKALTPGSRTSLAVLKCPPTGGSFAGPVDPQGHFAVGASSRTRSPLSSKPVIEIPFEDQVQGARVLDVFDPA